MNDHDIGSNIYLYGRWKLECGMKKRGGGRFSAKNPRGEGEGREEREEGGEVWKWWSESGVFVMFTWFLFAHK